MAESGFWAVPTDLTIWSVLNSQLLATLVGAVVAILVAIYGKKAADAAVETAAEQGAQTASQQAFQLENEASEEVEKEIDRSIADDPAEKAADFRDQTKAIVDEARDFLNGAAEKDPDGRHQRTYKALSRYDYIPLAAALSARERLTHQQLAAAVSLFSRWKFYERGKASKKSVPEDLHNRMREWLEALKGDG